MSKKILRDTIAALPQRPWTTDDVAKLREATGANVGGGEAVILRELLAERWAAFNGPGRRAMELLTGTAAPDLRPTRLTLGRTLTTGVAEQSSLTFISPELGFVTVDDESSVVWRLPFPGPHADRLEAQAMRPRDGAMANMESSAFDDVARTLLTASEGGRVHGLALRGDGAAAKLGRPELLGTLTRIQGEPNKGWEGLAVLPARSTLDGRARIVAVHEGSPVAIGIFDRDTLAKEQILTLPDTMNPLPADLSDLAFDPETGRFFLLSDESRLIWEIELRQTAQHLGPGPLGAGWAIIPIGATELPRRAGKDPQPEGIAIDHRGDVWVSCERGTALLHFERDRSAGG